MYGVGFVQFTFFILQMSMEFIIKVNQLFTLKVGCWFHDVDVSELHWQR